ncbi:MAG TPA: hypothetical protein VGB73_17465 [Pyrinomonadaceae bacterium]|jgi:hypothetical protein
MSEDKQTKDERMSEPFIMLVSSARRESFKAKLTGGKSSGR